MPWRRRRRIVRVSLRSQTFQNRSATIPSRPLQVLYVYTPTHVNSSASNSHNGLINKTNYRNGWPTLSHTHTHTPTWRAHKQIQLDDDYTRHAEEGPVNVLLVSQRRRPPQWLSSYLYNTTWYYCCCLHSRM